MITFDLKCVNGHRFEGWFQSREAFDSQMEQAMIACPVCDAREVSKQPSKVAVRVSRNAPSQGPGTEKVEALAFFKELREFIDKNFEDLGPGFAKEALKIKAGEAPERAIRGTTTQLEEETLADEGVDFVKIGLPKYDA